MREDLGTSERERQAGEPAVASPPPPGFWVTAVYCLLVILLLFSGRSGPASSEVEALLIERQVEAEIRIIEAIKWMTDSADDGPVVASRLVELANTAGQLAMDEATPAPVREQLAAVWLIYREKQIKPKKPAAPSKTAPVDIKSKPEDPTKALAVMLPEPAKDGGVRPFSTFLKALAAGEPANIDDLSEFPNAHLSPWLRSRLAAYAGAPTEPLDAGSAHALREKSHLSQLFILFMCLLVLGLLGLVFVIAAPFVWGKYTKEGLAFAPPLPAGLDRWRGPYVIGAWFAVFVTSSFVYAYLRRILFGAGAMSPIDFVVPQLVHGFFALWFIGRMGLVGGPYTLSETLAELRTGLNDLGGRLLKPILWGVGGYAAAIPAVLAASLIQMVLPFGDNISANPVLPLVLEPPDVMGQVFIVFSVVMLAPFFEECLFRGYLYRYLRIKMGVRKAVILSAIVFALVHCNPGAIMAYFALGVVMALVAEGSGGLLAGMIVHGLWNGASLLQALALFGP